MARRFWLPAEDLLVVAHHAERTPTHLVAAELGRTVIAVHARYTVLGLPPWHPRWPGKVLARVRRLHARGLPDRAVAGELGLSHDQAKHLRKRLDLPTNPDRDAKRRGVASQLKTLGLSSPTELRTRAYRRFAVENGWPADLRPREVQVLNVLAAAGVPMTRRQLAEAIGMRSDPAGYAKGQQNLLCGNGPGGTYTASLARRGLVLILAHAGPRVSAAKRKGAGRRVSLYTLGPAALALLEERARCEAPAAT